MFNSLIIYKPDKWLMAIWGGGGGGGETAETLYVPEARKIIQRLLFIGQNK